MTTRPAQSPLAASNATAAADPRGATARAPLCFVVDEDASIRHFLSLILHGIGIDTEEFADGYAVPAALARRTPDLVFLDIPLDSTEAIKCVVALAGAGYGGRIQITSSRGSAMVAHVKRIGEQRRLQMLPPLKKPFETGVILKTLGDLKLGEPPASVGRIHLDEALNSGWIEFWYQPKIDLRKKQLVGAEAVARARHPQHGILVPGAFLPGATDASLIKLAELALTQALNTGLNFAKLGLHLRLSVNISASVLEKVAVAEIVQSYRPQFEKWPGLTIDVMEEQIITNLALATDIAKKLEHLDVALAIDHFGRGYPQLSQLKTLPFAEIKLDRKFITESGTDKVSTPLCKTIIDHAHNFGKIAVAIGIERASDALALISMGCDHGQGFLLGQPMLEERFISLLRQRTAAQGRPLAGASRVAEKQPA